MNGSVNHSLTFSLLEDGSWQDIFFSTSANAQFPLIQSWTGFNLPDYLHNNIRGQRPAFY